MESVKNKRISDEEEWGAYASSIIDTAKNINYGVIDSFSGSGGISEGLRQAGFSLLFAFDIDEKAVKTYCNNLGNHCIQIDATTLSAKDLLDRVGLQKGDLPLFAGGPPCQGFSKQKRGAHLGDTRNDLILEYIRLVKDVEPRFFLFENVEIFAQKRGKQYLLLMHDKFSNYQLYPHFYNSADYGLAQTRKRFILVGKRKDQEVTFRIPPPITKHWKTVGEVIGDLPEPPQDFSEHPNFPNHQRARVTEANIKRFSYVPQGGGWQDIPMELRLDCHNGTNPKHGGWTEAPGELGELLYALSGWVARMESQRRSERTKAGLARVKAQGKRLGRPLGARDKKKRRGRQRLILL